jgi:hypothetical protein
MDLSFPNINPVIFSFSIGKIEFALRWYALSYIAGILVDTSLAGEEDGPSDGDWHRGWTDPSSEEGIVPELDELPHPPPKAKIRSPP